VGAASNVRPVSMTMRKRLRAALPAALKQRDAVLVKVLRTTLAALDNAEAVPVRGRDHTSHAVEATRVGVGAGEVARRNLSSEDVERLVRAEVSERQDAARFYEQADQHEHARRLRQEADMLAAVAGLSGESDLPTAPR
jgi:uncharacterized protein YqeY